MKTTPRAIFGLLIILTLALGACGGSPEADVDQPEPTEAIDNPVPTATTEPAPTATAVPAEPTATAAEPTAESEPVDESEESDPPPEEQTVSAGNPNAGEEHFQQVCFACHGADGAGIEGLGKDLTTSEFVAGLDDAELLAFIQEGRPVDHPDNTTGVAMPPRGGNPDFTDDQLLDIIAFIRTLQEQ